MVDYDSPSTPRHDKKPNSILSTLAVLVIAPLIALLLTAFVFQSYQVDGESMETTLSHNDRLLVWKVPKTWSRLTDNPYIPKRGDVVIFTESGLSGFGQTSSKQLIKRVIALPGERVVITDGVVTVYNERHPDGFEPDKILPYGKAIQATKTNADVVVPEASVFVLGDNRGNSLDSRTFGPVHVEDVVGKLLLRVWPLGNAKAF